MTRTRTWCLLIAAAAFLPSIGAAESLWKKRSPAGAYLFVDNRARNVGDLLTIVVQENTDVDFKEKRDMEKKTKTGGVFKFKGSTSGVGTKSASADLDASQTSERDFEGKSDFTADRRFTDRITVTVVDVLPNGNLVVQGFRRHMISGEERMLQVSGVVRPNDIGAGNLVQSQFVADLNVTYQGRGVDSSFSGQGWLGRAMNRVWPF